MDLVVVEYEDVSKELWDEFVYSNNEGWAYFLYDVIALDRWINDKNKSFCIMDEKSEHIVLIAQLHMEKRATDEADSYRLHSRWGYVIKDGLTKKQEKQVCDKYREHIDNYYQNYNILSFESALAPLTEANYPKTLIVNPLMKIGFIPSVRYTWITELNRYDEDYLISRCEQTTRQAIRKLKTNDRYTVVESDGSEKDFLRYKQLHEDTYLRTGAAHCIIYDEYHENIFYNLIPEGRCKVFFLKDLETKEEIAATIILLYKNTAYYWWGASVDKKEVGINKYLLWESAIRTRDYYFNNSKNSGDTFAFEMGGAYPYKRSGKEKGLNDYKKCFGCRLYPIYTGTYDHS